MIARTWSGKVPQGHAASFHQHLLETGVRDYEQHGGCLDTKILRRDCDGWSLFLLFSVWESWDAIRAYAGDTPEQAILYPDDERFGLVPDLNVLHYDIAYSTESAEAKSNGRACDH